MATCRLVIGTVQPSVKTSRILFARGTEHAEELQVSPMKCKLLLHSSYTGHAVEQYVNIPLPSMPRHLSNVVPGRP